MTMDRGYAAIVLAMGDVPMRARANAGRSLEQLLGHGVHVAMVAATLPTSKFGAIRLGPARRWHCRPLEGGYEVMTVDGAGPTTVHIADVELPQWLLEQFWDLGVGPASTAFVGLNGTWTQTGSGSPRRIPPQNAATFLDGQVARRRECRIPDLDLTPGWTLPLDDDDPSRRRVIETLLSLGDTRFATRGTPSDPAVDHEPLVAASGVYTQPEGPDQHLLPAAGWTQLVATGQDVARRRLLDLRSGVLLDEADREGRIRVMRLMSLARPGVTALRAEDPTRTITPVHAPGPVPPAASPADHVVDGMHTTLGTSAIVAVARTDVTETTTQRVIDRVAVYEVHRPESVTGVTARQQLDLAAGLGFDQLLSEQRIAWARRWADADVVIEGDPDAQVAIRFCLFHLMASVPTEGEAAVGARGLSGHAYAGHVFWDADVYVLPFLAATHPRAARAMLQYRIRRLPEARALAARHGHRGARFPWESAASGIDVTPRFAEGPNGEVIPILTGQHEDHISADVAWAASHYVDWSGDTAFLVDGPGRALIVETAEYWASRIRIGSDGRGHIDDVIGPDEYHERVNDNAYTNIMARWNLRRAADLLAAELPDMSANWCHLADALADGYDTQSKIHEQFAGYRTLEPLMIGRVATPPIAADMLLGRDRIRETQVIKQADVVMLHHLVPDDLAPGSLVADLDHYLPRTAHGSSLSPAIHAAVLARAGRPDEALGWFRIAARLDLDDLTGTTAGGLHLAAMGGAWQAIAQGFLGMRISRTGELSIDPCLPSGWDGLELRCRVRGRQVHVRADHAELAVQSDGPLVVRSGGAAVTVDGTWTTPLAATERSRVRSEGRR